MIQKHPGQVELFRDMIGERLDAHGLCRVMAGIKDIDAQLFCVEEGPVLPFSGHECVEPCRHGLWNQGASRSRDDAEPLYPLRTERKDSWCGAQCLRESPDELFARAAI